MNATVQCLRSIPELNASLTEYNAPMGGMAAAMQDNATSITSGEGIFMQSSFAILMIKFFIN